LETLEYRGRSAVADDINPGLSWEGGEWSPGGDRGCERNKFENNSGVTKPRERFELFSVGSCRIGATKEEGLGVKMRAG
jgi:hypothetical protein